MRTGPAAGVRARTAGPRRTCRTRRTRPPSSARSWTGPSCGKPGHAEILDLYRRLIALRRSTRRPVRSVAGPGAGVARRPFGGDPPGSVCGGRELRTGPQTIPMRAEAGEVLLATEPGVVLQRDGSTLPPESAAVFTFRLISAILELWLPFRGLRPLSCQPQLQDRGAGGRPRAGATRHAPSGVRRRGASAGSAGTPGRGCGG